MLEISGIGVLTAFAAGMISFLSPCVLPLVPAYVSYVTGKTIEDDRITARHSHLRILAVSLLFVLGFSLVFVTLGASATAVGSLLLRYKYGATIIGGTVVLVLGLFLTGLLKVSWLGRDIRSTREMWGRARRMPPLGWASRSRWAGRRASARCWARYSP